MLASVTAAPRRWAVTFTATALSTCALDAIATGAGVALVASGLVAGLDHALVFGFLVLSYAAWGAGLRVNLRANRALLERTGTRTNALSKAAHDLVALRWESPRARVIAAGAGYV